MWNELKQSKLDNKKFRRQQSIDNYIVDFYCPQEKLIIELDGEGHFTEEGLKYDKECTKYLENLGLKVIRFENDEVRLNIVGVLRKIKESFSDK